MSTQTSNQANYLKLIIFLTIIFTLMLTVKADLVPHPWFDEGWTLTTARNWLEQGKYALHLSDKWVSAETMTQSFTVTAPIAISFKIFGIGLISGRLPNILYTIGMLAWIFAIARQLYGNRVAWGTLLITLILPPSLAFQPLIVGRQALGEIPMLFFLLGGYWFLHQALKQPHNFYFILSTSILWGLAIITKLLPVPFWLTSLALPLFLAFKNKDYQTMKSFAVITICTGIFAVWFMMTENNLLTTASLYGAPVSSDYLKLLVWNTDPPIRFITALKFINIGFFPIVGIVYALQKNWGEIKSKTQLPPHIWVEVSLWSLTCSWTIWFLCGSWGWSRYYMPAYIICWLFFAKALHDWTEGFSWQKTVKKFTFSISKSWMNSLPQLGIILSLAISVYGLWANTNGLISALRETDRSIYTLTDYIHANTAPTTIIETYESEFLFMLPDRLIHFPPHQIQEELNRRTFLNENIAITYDPLTVAPEILIIGDSGRTWHLYDPILKIGNFKLVAQIGRYNIYQHVR